MTKHNAKNERLKRKYFAYLKEAKRHSEPTVDAAAKALDRFEADTNHRDFKKFHPEQAIAFKRHLAYQDGQRSGKKLSKATLYATLRQLKGFFQWLSAVAEDGRNDQRTGHKVCGISPVARLLGEHRQQSLRALRRMSRLAVAWGELQSVPKNKAAAR